MTSIENTAQQVKAKEQCHTISRRTFLKQISTAAGSLLILGWQSGVAGEQKSSSIEKLRPLDISSMDFQANNFVAINADGFVYIVCSRSEMGQGVRTSVPSIIADEMEADWSRVIVVQGDGDQKYGNQNTDGSTSIRRLFDHWRKAGATVRSILQQAAGEKWGVSASECRVINHHVIHTASNKVLGFGELVEYADQIKTPNEVSFKSPSERRYIGKWLKSIDNADIVTGKAIYGADINLPNMVYASIERCPVMGGKVDSYDASNALKKYGVLTTVKMPEMGYPVHFKPWGGIAVIATNTWSAISARPDLKIHWNKGKNEKADTTQSRQAMTDAVTNPATLVKKQGDVAQALRSATTVIDAVYHTPMMAHSPMEPLSCVASYTEDGCCEIWAPTQTPQSAQKHVAQYLDLKPENVTVHVTLLGGAFGRKAKPDFIVEAAFISKSVGRPVKLQWTREDDIRFSYYHAPSVQYLKAGLDKSGKLIGWLHRTAFPTIQSTFTDGADYPAKWEHNGGFSSERYDIPNTLFEGGKADNHVRIGWFRAVASNQHSFVVNAFTGECAFTAKQDQLSFFLSLLGGNEASDELAPEELDTHNYNPKRMRKVLKTVAKAADWGKTLPKHEAIGLAVNWSFDSYTAHAVHVDFTNGNLNVKSVQVAIDCGTCINRDRVASQMEGATLMGLCWAKYHEITTEKGAVQQSNFHDYQMLRINEAPDINVHIIDNQAKPGGAGEPGITTVVPALTNALLQITGKPIRQLPMKL